MKEPDKQQSKLTIKQTGKTKTPNKQSDKQTLNKLTSNSQLIDKQTQRQAQTIIKQTNKQKEQQTHTPKQTHKKRNATMKRQQQLQEQQQEQQKTYFFLDFLFVGPSLSSSPILGNTDGVICCRHVLTIVATRSVTSRRVQ